MFYLALGTVSKIIDIESNNIPRTSQITTIITKIIKLFKPADAIIIVMALTHIQILSSSKEETS